MTTTNSTEVALFCTSESFNTPSLSKRCWPSTTGTAASMRIRTNEEGEQIMWHKGHRRTCGVFKASDRA